MKRINTLEDAFIHALADVYSAEKQLTKALPKMARAACSDELAEGFENHLDETEDQIERIEQIIDMLDIKLPRMRCHAMEGLIEESEEILHQMDKGPIRDALLIAGAQKVEHYEIASYGCLVEWARQLGYADAVDLLQETLEEEKSTDEKLNDIAISSVNEDAERAAA